MKNKSIILATIVTTSVVLSGCSALNTGGSEYACPGMPNGVICKSPSEVYGMTNGGRTINMSGDDKTIVKHTDSSIAANGLPGRLLEPMNGPMPILQPAEVMRIWIAPWQDDAGDLNWPSHIFTEVTPRRWSIGEKSADVAPIIVPVAMNDLLNVNSAEPSAARPKSNSNSPRIPSTLPKMSNPLNNASKNAEPFMGGANE